MPFTPFHMGPGLLIKSLLQGSFSLMIFGWTQIVMDVQPLVAMTSGIGKLHGFTHTYVGATLIAVFAAATGKYLAEWALTKLFDLKSATPIRWWVVFLSAFIGAYSHVLLDSIMHADLEPWSPFAEHNALLGLVSVPLLHRVCIYSGIVGAILYFVIGKLFTRKGANGDIPNGRIGRDS